MSDVDPNQALALRDLAQAQEKKLDEIAGDYATIKKATVIALESEGEPAVTINMSGDESVDIPGVHYLDYYAPVVGDTVHVLHQGAELLVLGKAAINYADGTWTTADLSTGWSHDGSGANGAGPVMYRRIIDHGAYKIQWKGGAVRSSGTSFLCDILPVGLRPTSRRIFVQPRNSFYTNDVKIQFETSGLVTVQGMELDINGTTNYQNTGGTGFASNSHQHYVPAPASVYTEGQTSSHNHYNDHYHSFSVVSPSPTWVILDGCEYFL